MSTSESNKDIVERIPAYSNEMMYRQCLLLKKVMDKSDNIKVGHGKKATIEKRYRYNSNSDHKIREKINRSVEHYKELWNLETTKSK